MKRRPKNYYSYFGTSLIPSKNRPTSFHDFKLEEEIYNIISGDSHVFLISKNSTILGMGNNMFG